MTIADAEGQGKTLTGRIPTDLLIALILVLSSTLAFGLGYLAGKEAADAGSGQEAWIEQLPERASAVQPAAAIEALRSEPAPAAVPEGPRVYVASKNGTKYYLPTCGTAKRILEENKVWFATKQEAEAAGYGAAANCPGL